MFKSCDMLGLCNVTVEWYFMLQQAADTTSDLCGVFVSDLRSVISGVVLLYAICALVPTKIQQVVQGVLIQNQHSNIQ